MNIPNLNFAPPFGTNRRGGGEFAPTTDQLTRNAIRARIEASLETPGGRMSEAELKSYVAGLNITSHTSSKIKSIDREIIGSIGLRNLQPVYGIESYRGGMCNLDENKVQKLKQAGIKRVIDLEEYPYQKETCENCGMEYLHFPVRKIFGASHGTDHKDEITKFIQTMQKDNAYIGCEYGTYNTDEALMLNHFFNPKAKETKTYSKDNIGLAWCFIDVYESLSDEDKKKMGWNDEFDANFMGELKKHFGKYI